MHKAFTFVFNSIQKNYTKTAKPMKEQRNIERNKKSQIGF